MAAQKQQRFTTIAISKEVKSELDKIKGEAPYNRVLIDLLCTSVLPIEHAICEITEKRMGLLREQALHIHKRLDKVAEKHAKIKRE
ncbi:MAG: hypothetical protein MSIBF_01890 [Candidatus Altiarchaeales archaeon IMC4]|nr:MAG: hypothetical protein MSIBF_01890 [Candidatus Altiarchaeales archaeon IMC4]